MNLHVEFLLAAFCAFLGTYFPDKEGLIQANYWTTISPPCEAPLPPIMSPSPAEFGSAFGFLLPPTTVAPPLPTTEPGTVAAESVAAPAEFAAATSRPRITKPPAISRPRITNPPATSRPGITNPPATANPSEPEDDDVKAQSSRLQWFADVLFSVMMMLLALFMSFGESTNLLGFFLHHHHQVFVAKGRENRALRSTIAALQANPVLFALPPPTSDEDLDEPAQTASGSTQTEAVPYSSVATQTGVPDSATVWTQTDAVNHQSIGTQTIPDASPPADCDEVADLQATLAKQRQDSDLIIRDLQTSLARLGTESQQLRAQLLRASRLPAFASPPAGVVPTYAGLAFDPHHNPDPQANARQLAQNTALQQRQYQQSQPWPHSPGWQGHHR